jgi:aspartyl-tRNA(Asn)/glutamyl-tRNA(Gln) amidotransferase subunit A
MMRDALNLSLAAAADKIRTGELSPVALTEASLARIEATENRLNAFVRLNADHALAAAREADAEIAAGRYRGELHGIPVAVKDLYDMAGLPTTCSSRVRHDHLAEADSACVARLKAAGAVIVGKTHTHEFAYGIKTPTTGNPWNPDHIPGGSSGGSGATVAARGCFMGMGSDTGGSIRIPAAVCGLIGLKPTYGRVSRAGVASLSWSLDHVGPLTRTARDAAICLKWLAGYDPRDPGSADEPLDDYLSGLDAGINGLRIGVPSNYFFEHVDGEVEATVRAAIQQLESLGAIVKEVEIPFADLIMSVEFGLCLPEASAYHRDMLRERPDLYEADVRTFLEAGELIPATDYITALRVRQKMKLAWRAMYADIDVVVGPAVAAPATPRTLEAITWSDGTEEPVTPAFVRLSAPANVTGLPSVAVPCGFSEGGLPVAFQAIGRPFGEAQILRVAAAYQGVTEWHERAPTV